ncbi:MAG: hypothetical protein IPL94_09585 [Tetrasphaera sp.]|nr:hypothetical protein [Tetrasphaera sp.]
MVSRQVRHVIGNLDRDQWLDVYFALTHLDLPEIRETRRGRGHPELGGRPCADSEVGTMAEVPSR